MTQGIQTYGALGGRIAANARVLRDQKLLTPEQFKELTNSTFSQKDFAAVNAAMEKARNGQQLASTSQLNSDIIALRPSMTPDPKEKPMGLWNALLGLVKAFLR